LGHFSALEGRYNIYEIPEDFLICDLLKAHKAEVSEMLETEYNQEEVLKIVAEDAARRSEKKFSELIKKNPKEKLI